MQKIKQNDEVIVIAGKYKGKRGKVIKVIRDKCRFLVEGINLVKKHVKPNPQVQEPGGIKELEMPIHASNVAILNPSTNKADKVGIKTLEDGTKVRFFKSNDEVIDI